MPETLAPPQPEPKTEAETEPDLDFRETAEFEVFHNLLREETSAQMAALILYLLLEQQSRDLVIKAHTPDATEETNRMRWEKIVHGLPGVDAHTSIRYPYAETQGHPTPNFNASPTPTTEAYPSQAPMPFEIYPAGMQPNETERAGAARANNLMRTQLEKQGWIGGTPTEAQVKKATQGVLRSLHPDTNPDLSAADQEAGKLISSQMRDITKDLFGEKVGDPTPPPAERPTESPTPPQTEQPTEAQAPTPNEHQPEPTVNTASNSPTPPSHNESGPAAIES